MANKDKARHAFGALENVDVALQNKVIDNYDILFVKDAKGKPYVGWVDKDGNKVIVNDDAEFAALESQIAEKADVTVVEAGLATKANTADVEALESQIATKVSAEEVNAKIATKADVTEVEAKISKAATDTVASANAYTDKMVEAAMGEHLTKKYEITDVPEGTLVDYRESEIRVMCPANAVFTKQNVGAGGDANSYYMTFKTYFPENAVGYIEHLNGQADEEILTKLSTDEYGRKYQPTWLALAKYNESTGEWTYYGASSTSGKMIGWDYQIDWFDANNVMIASDSVRINLSNEGCHSSIEPYYVGKMMGDIETIVDTKVEEKIKEVESSYEIIEF